MMPPAPEKQSVANALRDVDLNQLLVTRLWLARLGERDVQGWWHTVGVLGADGAFVGPRVLPLTHACARARIAFAVARHACDQRHPDPHAHHLFRLDADVDDQLDAFLLSKLEDAGFWKAVMPRLEAVGSKDDPKSALVAAQVITDDDARYVTRLKLGPDARSVPIPPGGSPAETLRRLAAGFLRSSGLALAVPYIAN
jgi:hypothetical protein